MLGKCFKNASKNVYYYASGRDYALEEGRGNFATQQPTRGEQHTHH